MEKKFKVVAISAVMDAEYNCRYKDQAQAKFNEFVESGAYSWVYITDASTGELYRTYNRNFEAEGISVSEWQKLEW